MLVVDFTVWIDYFNGRITPHTEFLDHFLERQIVLVGDLILAEILQGFRLDADFERARRALGRFQQISLVNPVLAVQSARNFRLLRQKGITVRKTIDGIIATCCIENGYDLIHTDSDFDPYERFLGLQVIHP